MPEPSAFEVEMAVLKLIWCHKLSNSIWNKEKFPEEWKESIIVPIYKKGYKQIVVNIEAYHFSQLRIKVYSTFCCQG